MTATTKHFLWGLLGALALAATPACVGEVPPDDGDDPGADAGVDDELPQQINVTGTVGSYFGAVAGNNEPLVASLSTEGLAAPISVTSAADGAYTFADVPADSVFFVTATVAVDYRPTRNEPLAVIDQGITAPLFAVSTADAARQYTSAGAVVEDPITALVIIDLRRNNGDPQIGVTQADVALLDALQAPVALDLALNGPYFVGLAGDAAPIADVPASVTVLGKSRAVLLNVPAGSYTLKVTSLNGGGTPVDVLTPIVAAPGGVTLVRSQGIGGGGGGGGGG